MHLFTYGSLMFPAVWSVVVAGDYASAPACVTRYLRKTIKGDTYPAVIAADTDNALKGRLYFDIDQNDLRRLDRFEGEYYRRESTLVSYSDGSSVEAEIYVLRNRYRHLLGDESWDPGRFERESLYTFIADYRGF